VNEFPTNPAGKPDPLPPKDQVVRRDDEGSGWISGSGGPLPRRYYVMITHDDGDVFTYLVSAENELTAAAKAGAQHSVSDDDSDLIAAVDIEPWTAP